MQKNWRECIDWVQSVTTRPTGKLTCKNTSVVDYVVMLPVVMPAVIDFKVCDFDDMDMDGLQVDATTGQRELRKSQRDDSVIGPLMKLVSQLRQTTKAGRLEPRDRNTSACQGV